MRFPLLLAPFSPRLKSKSFLKNSNFDFRNATKLLRIMHGCYILTELIVQILMHLKLFLSSNTTNKFTAF